MTGLTDNGRSWIEDDMVCAQYEIIFNGYKTCMSVFKNPEGTSEMKNEYIGVSLSDFMIFSPID